MLHYRYHILLHPFTLQYHYQRYSSEGVLLHHVQTVHISRDYQENARQIWDAYRWLPDERWNILVEDLKERCPVGWAKWEEEFEGPPGEGKCKEFIPARMRRRLRHWNRTPYPNRSRNGH